MPATSTIVDDFSDGTINTGLWSGNANVTTETGGRIQVPCTTGFSALKTANSYTLDSVHMQVWAPAASTATEAYADLVLYSAGQAGGTDVLIHIDVVAQTITARSRTGYFDGTDTPIAYSATNHRWLRIRISGGSTLFETSPDGRTWTTLRTISTPAWLSAATDLSVAVESHRDAGTADVAEVDNVNVPGPPWLNQTSGTAARNGTTSHTINFGWTSTSGSLLVAFIYGAVTHTVSGWTEQEQPVNSGELSMFTKTSAGDSSITVTHNGSNYPVHWAVYEFPTGSTFTGSDSDFDTVQTFPTLSGLPGTAQFVLAARGRTATTSEVGASTAWTAPWFENTDLFIAPSPTDGCYLTVGHQLDVTATSITPSATTTYSGTWPTTDYQRIVAAFAVAAPTTTITRTVNDSAGLADAAAAATAFTRTQTDVAGLVDTQTRSLARALTDLVGTVDTTTRVSAHARTQTDVAGLVDTATPAAGFVRTQNDSGGLVDSVTQQLFTLITRTITDDAGLRDVDATQALDVAETITDSTGLTDSATPVLTPSGSALTRTVDDPAGLADNTSKVSAHARALDDSTGAVDTTSTQLAGAGTRQVDDTAGITDSVTYSSTQTLADSAGLSDTAIRAVAAARMATDGLGLTDSVTAQLNASTVHTRTITDSAGLTSTHRCVRLTRRPHTGITHRPNLGTTSRYALIPD